MDDDHRNAEFRDGGEVGSVRQLSGADLESRNADVREHPCAVVVEGGGEERDPPLGAVVPQLNPGGLGQRQAPQHLGLGLREPGLLLVRRGVGRFRDQGFRLEGLELHCVGAGIGGHVDQFMGNCHVTVVIHSRLGNDEDFLVRADAVRTERHMLGFGFDGHRVAPFLDVNSRAGTPM